MLERLEEVELPSEFVETSDYQNFRHTVLRAQRGVLDGRRWASDELSVMLTVDEGPEFHLSVARRNGSRASDSEVKRLLLVVGMPDAVEKKPEFPTFTRHFIEASDAQA